MKFDDWSSQIECKVWSKALVNYGKINLDLILQSNREIFSENQRSAEGIVEDDEISEDESEEQKQTEYNQLMKLARKYLFSILEADLSNLQELVDVLLKGIEKELAQSDFLKIKPNHKTRKDKLPPPIIQRELNEKGHRVRLNWSAAEDKILIQGYQEYNKDGKVWSKVCIQLLNRTHLDCKDRWRNLLKKHKSEKAIYELLQPVSNS
jgi:hypothetical protein